MNFLAHLVLAPQSPQSLLGSIAPDMVRGPLPKDLHPDAAAAAAEHQRIDRFTDAHPVFHRTRQRLEDITHARLTGILTDVLYDHVLASDWKRWRTDERSRFIAESERKLLSQVETMPADMRLRVQLMTDESWLTSYATAAGICNRLETMSKRISVRFGRPIKLAPTGEQLREVYPDLLEDFATFWPELCAYVEDHRGRESKSRLAS